MSYKAVYGWSDISSKKRSCYDVCWLVGVANLLLPCFAKTNDLIVYVMTRGTKLLRQIDRPCAMQWYEVRLKRREPVAPSEKPAARRGAAVKVRVGGGVHDSYRLQCGIDTR